MPTELWETSHFGENFMINDRKMGFE